MASEHHASINHEYLFAGIVMTENRIICIKMCVTALSYLLLTSTL